MKLITVVGARPQFIKAAAVSRILRQQHTEILVHTGQHYDKNMSGLFFEELDIPKPDINLGIGSGLHGAQTGEMLARIEQVLLDKKPDRVLVYGDTNSTLAGALAAAKLRIPIAHVEAGLRSFNRAMPEEVNRVLTDHVSDLLFSPSQTAATNLATEGITRGVHLVGDVMYDALKFAVAHAQCRSCVLERLKLNEREYLLATIHRPENTDDPTRLGSILSAFAEIKQTIIFPVHPRTRKMLETFNLKPEIGNLRLIESVGYLDMVRLEQSARMILTDSGGIQKEAYWLGVPCITLRNETEWVETCQAGCNILTGANVNRILSAVQSYSLSIARWAPLAYGNGNTAKEIVKLLRIV